MKEIILNSVKLCIITLIAGVLLGTVYEITKEPRKKQEEKSKNEAYAKVFKDASKFEEIQYDKDGLSNFLEDNGYKKTVAYIDEIVSASNESGEILGYVITVTDKEGYGGEIKFTLGIQNDGTINGISFLTLAETAGVGMKADESKFKNQFAGMKAETIEYVKSGKNADNQIDAISGATVTTNAVTNGVNAGILAFQYISSYNEANSNSDKTDDADTKNTDTDINSGKSDDKVSNDEKSNDTSIDNTESSSSENSEKKEESSSKSSDNDSDKQDEASNNDEEKQENSSNNDKEKQENSSDNDEEIQKNSSDNDEEIQKNSSDNDEGTEKNNTNDSVTEENSKNGDEKGEESDE